MVQQIAFRTDATSQIGTGHFMRCLTLADALSNRGAHIRFVSRDLPIHLRDMLTEKGIEFVSLESCPAPSSRDELAHAHWLGTSQSEDAQDTLQALSGHCWDWLIVDHYALNARWETAMRSVCKQIMVIDDIADRKHDCDVLLDQNFYTDMQTRYIDKVPEHCQLLLGPRYALLRDEFRKLREQVQPRKGPVKRLLVFFGGVDADNCTSKAIQALSEIGTEGLAVDVVIGAQHPNRDEIETDCAIQGFCCHIQTTRMAELMATADLAIGAGGSATLERGYLGLPSMVLVLAENQKNSTKDLNAAGVIVNLGSASEISIKELVNTISSLISNESLRSKLSITSLKMFSTSYQNEVIKMLVS